MKCSDEGPNALQWFLTELEQRVKCPDARRAVIGILRGMAGQRMFLASGVLVKADRPRIAHRLLEAGYTATQARKEIARRCGVSQRTAERVVATALTQRTAEAVVRLGPHDA